LKKIGVVIKRAKYFITCSGRSFEKPDQPPALIRQRLLLGESSDAAVSALPKQLVLPGLFA